MSIKSRRSVTSSPNCNSIIVKSDLSDESDIMEMIQEIESKHGCKLVSAVGWNSEVMYIFSR